MKKLIALAVIAIAGFAICQDYTPASEEKGIDVQTSAVTNVVTTTFTPAYVGQLLIGTVSNVVYVAEDTTTNGWIQISN